METLNNDTFKSKVFNYESGADWKFEGQVPTIIDFYADWCGPCKALTPVLEKISKDFEGKVQIYKVDTEASPELAALFKIRSIPSILFVPATGLPTMAQGFMPEDALKKAMKDLFQIDSQIDGQL